MVCWQILQYFFYNQKYRRHGNIRASILHLLNPKTGLAGDVTVGVSSPVDLAGNVTVGVSSSVDLAGGVTVGEAPSAVAGVASSADIAEVAPSAHLAEMASSADLAEVASSADLARNVTIGVTSLADPAGVVTTGVAFQEKCDVPSGLVCDLMIRVILIVTLMCTALLSRKNMSCIMICMGRTTVGCIVYLGVMPV